MEFADAFFHDPSNVLSEETCLRWRVKNTFIDFYTCTDNSSEDAKQRLHPRSKSVDSILMTVKHLHESDEPDEIDDPVCMTVHSDSVANIDSQSSCTRVHDIWSDAMRCVGSGAHDTPSDQIQRIGSGVHDINQKLLVNIATMTSHLEAGCAKDQFRNKAKGNIPANTCHKSRGCLMSMPRWVSAATTEDISTSHLSSNGVAIQLGNLAASRDVGIQKISSQQQAQTKCEDDPAPPHSSMQLASNSPQKRRVENRHVRKLFATQLQKLEDEDEDRVVVMRKINRLGYDSANVLKQHYEQIAPVSEVLFTQTHDKADSSTSIRVRPSPMGFVIFESAQGAALVLARGQRQHVCGQEINARPFTKTRARHNNDGKEDPC